MLKYQLGVAYLQVQYCNPSAWSPECPERRYQDLQMAWLDPVLFSFWQGLE